MLRDIENEVLGLGPLEPLLADRSVSEILVNGAKNVFVERILPFVTKNLDDNKEVVEGVLQRLPRKLNTITRTATYGSWFNFYLCHFSAKIRIGGDVLTQVPYAVNAERCTLP